MKPRPLAVSSGTSVYIFEEGVAKCCGVAWPTAPTTRHGPCTKRLNPPWKASYVASAFLSLETLTMTPPITRNIGMLLLGSWLILMNLALYVPLIASLGLLLNVLGVAAGVFILIGR